MLPPSDMSAHTLSLPVPDGSVFVRPYDATRDSLKVLTELLHRAYAPLAALGFRFVATYQSEQETASRIQRGHCWVAELNGVPVATICLYSGPKAESSCAWYRCQGVWYFGQFAVEPHVQRSGVGRALLNVVEAYARRNAATELALDTAEGAQHLIEYYSRQGFRPVGFVQWDVTNYRSIVMSKTL